VDYGPVVFGFHPVNLAFRLVLELSAFAMLALGGYVIGDGPLGWAMAIALPLLAMAAWGTFNVPGDRSRSGRAPVAVPGFVRLLVELDVFAAAVVIGWFASPVASVTLFGLVAVHYALSIDRIQWLLQQRAPDASA